MSFVIHADCVEAMAAMEEDSVDAIVTDPPYGLEFMGKEWDRLTRNLMNPDSEADRQRKEIYGQSYAGRRSNLPDLSKSGGQVAQEWHHRWAEAALRVLKPGGHLLAFGGTRTHHRLACALEDAGFELRDTLCWLYGSGFPKSLDVSKALDKMAGAERETQCYDRYRDGRKRQEQSEGKSIFDGRNGNTTSLPATDAARQWDGWGTALKPAWEPIILCRKPLSEPTVAANVLRWGTGGLNVDGCRIGYVNESPPDLEHWKKTNGGWKNTSKAGVVPNDNSKGRWPANLVLDEEAAAMLDAQSGESKGGIAVRHNSGGCTFGGNNPKPPMPDMSYADTGGASRFFYCAKASRAERWVYLTCDCQTPIIEAWVKEDDSQHVKMDAILPGRDTSEESSEAGCDSPITSCGKPSTGQSPDLGVSTMPMGINSTTESKTSDSSLPPSINGFTAAVNGETANGGSLVQSAKNSNPSPSSIGTSPLKGGLSMGVVVPAISAESYRTSVCARCGAKVRIEGHPTQKPIALMRWLCRLVTPPNGIILDPFAGSGSTGCAAVLEGFRFVGIEKEAEYVGIAERRIEHWAGLSGRHLGAMAGGYRVSDVNVSTNVYVAYCRCGCGGIVMAVVDSPEGKRLVAREVARAIRNGETVERLTCEVVRQATFGCQKRKLQARLEGVG